MRSQPLDADKARRTAQSVLDHPGTDGVEVLLSGSSTGLTRYANSQIIQNTLRNEIRAYVRVVVGDHVASATTNQLDPDHLRRAAERAVEAARASLPDPEFPGLADPAVVGRPEEIRRWDEPTATTDPDSRALAVSEILNATQGANAAGIFETSSHAFGVMSSTGIDCFDGYTRCIATCLVDTGDATGWGEASSHALGSVDVGDVARRALRKAKAGSPGAAEAGTYEVVLEPSAVATLLDYLSYMGFGAKQVLEGDSFLAEKARARVAAPAVTVADDVFDPGSVGLGFDFEGVPKQRVAVIDAGTATRPVTDLRTARRLEATSTGHFSGSTEFGPWAANVVLEAGDASVDDLVGSVDDGFLVTRFHYVNVLDRPATLLTGMTRDGTFRISGGEVAEPVRNFRFAQSVLDALAAVTGVGNDPKSFAPDYSSFGSTVAPALRVGEFHFASTTTH